MVYRYDIINTLIKHFNYKTYLELGVRNKECFNKIDIENKYCVDCNPKYNATYVMTTDAFFNKNKKRYDIIFIDACHHWGMVKKDIKNSLECLNNNGTIVVHDIIPRDEISQRTPPITQHYQGNGWITWIKMRLERDDLEMYVVDTDDSCGIIRKSMIDSRLKNYPDNNFTFNLDLIKQYSNLITVDEFNKKYK
jgi:hypothetical protein